MFSESDLDALIDKLGERITEPIRETIRETAFSGNGLDRLIGLLAPVFSSGPVIDGDKVVSKSLAELFAPNRAIQSSLTGLCFNSMDDLVLRVETRQEGLWFELRQYGMNTVCRWIIPFAPDRVIVDYA